MVPELVIEQERQDSLQLAVELVEVELIQGVPEVLVEQRALMARPGRLLLQAQVVQVDRPVHPYQGRKMSSGL